jgi:hypothetical protein
MSRESVLSARVSSLIEPELPLRTYFLSAGGVLLLLLLAAGWVLPAPSSSRLSDSHSALPSIRIHSQLKGPEAVVIDTSEFGRPPTLPQNGDVAAPSQLPDAEMADAVDAGRNPPTSTMNTHLLDSLAQLQPDRIDQPDRSKKQHEITMRQRKFTRARSGKLQRSARHQSFATSLGNCVSLSRAPGACRSTRVSN